jgi:hypothetical protein
MAIENMAGTDSMYSFFEDVTRPRLVVGTQVSRNLKMRQIGCLRTSVAVINLRRVTPRKSENLNHTHTQRPPTSPPLLLLLILLLLWTTTSIIFVLVRLNVCETGFRVNTELYCHQWQTCNSYNVRLLSNHPWSNKPLTRVNSSSLKIVGLLLSHAGTMHG